MKFWSKADHVIYSYCTNKSPPGLNITDDHSKRYTFVELAQAKITIEQLHLWSAPIDVAERYQFYLDQQSLANRFVDDAHMDYFYNCSLPRFGATCEYELTDYQVWYTSTREIINNRHLLRKDTSSNMTCYAHLPCDRGSSRVCLDWSEICDGTLDCFDGQVDEEHC